MSGPHHIQKYPIEIHEGVDLSQMASAKIAALEKALNACQATLTWLDDRAKNSTSFGSHCHAYEVAARKLREALAGAVGGAR